MYFQFPTGNFRTPPPLLGASSGWEASLRVELAVLGSRTVVSRRESVGPLVIQRPFYPEGDVCHLYLVHPPGGVVGGDQVNLRVLANERTHSVITTPAATKFYRSDGRVARQVQEIEARGATVEWLPQETIVFPDAQACIATRVKLTGRSRFIGWEVACYGRPASGLSFGSGRVAQDFELWVDEVPVVLDHLRLDGASEAMSAAYGLAGQPVLGTMIAYPATEHELGVARSAIHESSATTVAASRVDGVLVCRAVASQADAVRRAFTAIWRSIRPTVAGREAVAPRIWAT